ncbi:MAG: nucleoside-diphosphate sugar epimerase [Lentisphaerae bacterium RIFOXYB12_FULL_65_16]|nr:MAG: nucleoside-diphosphate sugar epimerase [Lentisphaerae bacterium RIFOXYA12_64_32]OGV85514.1 MAG: nucleoside-diphosphate sugar epimerase [Lentisphaerae bacterium RIFOXYB12_FULL_65_16]
MKLLITGALGHIGSRLIHSLRPGDFEEVCLVDDLSSQRYCSLFNLPPGVPVRFVQADVCATDLRPLTAGIDVVIHLAAITDAAGSFSNAEEVERVNFAGTQRVAEACAASGCRLLFPSTTSVYGTTASVVDEAGPETDLKPQSPYAASKLRAEVLLQAMGREAGLRHTICRLGTIFGTSPGMRFHTAINKFAWQACTGQPLTVWRSAMQQMRPYLDVRDAVRAFSFIVQTNRFDRETYNLVTVNTTVSEIVAEIRGHIPDLSVEYVDSPIMNQLSYEVSAEKFRRLGFEFSGNLREGIEQTVSWLRNVRTARLRAN